jgi:hypothetical protein
MPGKDRGAQRRVDEQWNVENMIAECSPFHPQPA